MCSNPPLTVQYWKWLYCFVSIVNKVFLKAVLNDSVSIESRKEVVGKV